MSLSNPVDWNTHFTITADSYGRLGKIGIDIQNSHQCNYFIDATFLRPYCLAFLDQTIWRLHHSNRQTTCTANPEVAQYLHQCGFAYLNNPVSAAVSYSQSIIVPLQRFIEKPVDAETSVVRWLKNSVIPFFPDLTTTLKKKITENLWEIVNNAIVHGQSYTGLSACGQFYPKMGYFEVAFYDAGVGIPKPVKTYLKQNLRDADCIEWATLKGNSTQPFNISAGLGLHLLKEFVILNQGVFQIVSGNGFYELRANQIPQKQRLAYELQGTLVNLRIIYDECQYKIKGEEQ